MVFGNLRIFFIDWKQSKNCLTDYKKNFEKVSLTDCIVHGRVVAAGEELRVEVDHDQAAVLGQRLQDVVLDVPARVAELVGRGV